MTEIYKQKLAAQIPSTYHTGLEKTFIQHLCPNCGKRRHSEMSKGISERKSHCMNCKTTYILSRSMRSTP